MASNLTAFPLTAKKLSELASKSTLAGTEVLQIVDSGTNKKTTVADINSYVDEQSKGLAQYYMVGNSTATTISATSTFYKIAGTTSQGITPDNFTLADNKATFTGSASTNFKVTAVLSLTAGNNQDIDLRIAKNGTTQARSHQEVTTSGSGSAQNIVVKDIFTLTTNDYIELFVANNTSTTNITVIDLNVIIEKLH